MDPIVLISATGESLTFPNIEAVAAHLNDPKIKNSKKGKSKTLDFVKTHLKNKTIFKIKGVQHSLLFLSEIKGLI